MSSLTLVRLWARWVTTRLTEANLDMSRNLLSHGLFGPSGSELPKCARHDYLLRYAHFVLGRRHVVLQSATSIHAYASVLKALLVVQPFNHIVEEDRLSVLIDEAIGCARLCTNVPPTATIIRGPCRL